MLKKLWQGLRLHCPNCHQATISNGLFQVNRECRHCGVQFERKSGESAGASIIWISLLPILALILFFVMYMINPDLSVPILLGVPLAFGVILGLVGYRHIKGLWIAIAYLTGDVYADETTSAT